jgi:hypothetical protein
VFFLFQVEPQPDWWFIGGRATPGDTTRAAAARNVKRELGLDLDVSRFKVIATYSMVWRMRQQDPVTNGTADISTVHSLQLTASEEGTITMDPREYSDSRYFSLDEISKGDFHPCLKQSVQDLHKRRALDTLIVAAEAHQGGVGSRALPSQSTAAAAAAAAAAAGSGAATTAETVTGGGDPSSTRKEGKDSGVVSPSSESGGAGGTTTAGILLEAALAFCRAELASRSSEEATKVIFQENRYHSATDLDASTSSSEQAELSASAAGAVVSSSDAAAAAAAALTTTTEPPPSAVPVAGFGGREDTWTAAGFGESASEGGGSSTAAVAESWLSEFPSAPPPVSSVVEAQLDAQLEAAGLAGDDSNSNSNGGGGNGGSSEMPPPSKKSKAK